MSHQSQVLVISQDADAKRNLDLILGELGFAVTNEPSVPEPESSFSDDAFDVIVVDVGPPGSKAAEHAGRVSRANPRIPVIAVTDRYDEETAALMTDRGVSGVVGKPMAAESMEGALMRALKARVEILPAFSDFEEEIADGPEAASEEVRGMQKVLRFLGNMALFLAAPFIALSYSLALPFVGLYVFVRRFFMAGSDQATGSQDGTV